MGKLAIEANMTRTKLDKLNVEARKWREKFNIVNMEAKMFKDEKIRMNEKIGELKSKVSEKEEQVRSTALTGFAVEIA